METNSKELEMRRDHYCENYRRLNKYRKVAEASIKDPGKMDQTF